MSIARRNARGFSLVELMIALVAGLLVVGAVLAFTLSSLRSNSEYIRATRLTQELRTTLNFVSDELRRAGYDEDALNYIFRPATFTASSPFAPISVSNVNADDGCIIYSYDRLPGVAGQLEPGNGELRAIRRAQRTVNGQVVGVIEFAESSATNATVSCSGGSPDYTQYPAGCNGNWCSVSDPRILNITRFALSDGRVANLPTSITGARAMQIRVIGIEIRGALLGAQDITRAVRSDVRVRADCVQDNPGTYSTPGNCARNTGI